MERNGRTAMRTAVESRTRGGGGGRAPENLSAIAAMTSTATAEASSGQRARTSVGADDRVNPVERACANSVVVLKRSAGTGARARRSAASSAPGTLGLIALTEGAGCESQRAITT